MQEIIEIIRIFVSLFFLFLSSWYDLKTREVSNYMWLFFAPTGFILTLLEFFITKNNLFLYSWLTSFLVTTGISLAIFYIGFYGGADAKALICLAITIPIHPKIFNPTFNLLSQFFPLSVFLNAIIGSASLVIFIIIYNLISTIINKKSLFSEHKNESLWKKIVTFIIGIKIDSKKINDKSHYMILEDFSRDEENKLVRHLKVSFRLEEEEGDEDNNLKILSQIKGKIWVTPGLPLLIFITTSFIFTLFFGDIISNILFRILPNF